MADLTSVLKATPTYKDNRSSIKEEAFFIDFVADGGSATGTHNVLNVGIGKALKGGRFYVIEAVTSSGSATVQFSINSNTLTGAITKANLALGDNGSFGNHAATATTTQSGYAYTTAKTLDIIVGGAVITAGKLLVIAEIEDVAAAVTAEL